MMTSADLEIVPALLDLLRRRIRFVESEVEETEAFQLPTPYTINSPTVFQLKRLFVLFESDKLDIAVVDCQ